jgi:hypothetical protein
MMVLLFQGSHHRSGERFCKFDFGIAMRASYNKRIGKICDVCVFHKRHLLIELQNTPLLGRRRLKIFMTIKLSQEHPHPPPSPTERGSKPSNTPLSLWERGWGEGFWEVLPESI